jgi:hypothetical protein
MICPPSAKSHNSMKALASHFTLPWFNETEHIEWTGKKGKNTETLWWINSFSLDLSIHAVPMSTSKVLTSLREESLRLVALCCKAQACMHSSTSTYSWPGPACTHKSSRSTLPRSKLTCQNHTSDPSSIRHRLEVLLLNRDTSQW